MEEEQKQNNINRSRTGGGNHTWTTQHSSSSSSWLVADSDNDMNLCSTDVDRKSNSEVDPAPKDILWTEKSYKRNQIAIIVIALSLGCATFPNLSINYFFKDDLNLDPTQLQLFNSIINFIWVLKPVFGFICDSYPLFGSHRKSYLILFSIVGSFGWVSLGFWVTYLAAAIIVKTLINISTSFVNVIGEGLMVESSQIQEQQAREQKAAAQYDNKKTATNVSIYLSVTAAFTIISSYLGGYLLQYYTTQQIFIMSGILPVLTIIAGVICQEQDKRNRSDLTRQAKCALAKANWGKVKMFLKFSFIYKPIIFIFLVVIAPGVDTAMFYYNTNVLGFTTQQYGTISVTESCASIIGVWTYRLVFKDTPFRKLLIMTTAFFSFTQACKLFLAFNVTQSWFNMSPIDFTYVIQFLYSLTNELHLMPLMVLAAKMCPKSVEATFYAFVLAVINLGYLVSYWLGGLLTYLLGITSDDFTNLWILILIAALFPLITLLFLLLLPKSLDFNAEEIERQFKLSQTSQMARQSQSSLIRNQSNTLTSFAEDTHQMSVVEEEDDDDAQRGNSSHQLLE